MERNAIDNVIKSIEETAKQNNPISKGDYVGEDGLLYCGICRSPKQARIENWFTNKSEKGHIVYVPCECRKREELQLQKEERRRKELEAIDKLKKSSLMDEKFLASRFETSGGIENNQKQLSIAQRYVDKFDELYKRNQGLIFWGDPGTGKTHVACCIGNRLMERLVPVFATSLVKLLEQAKSFRQNDVETLIARMNVAKLLILDDLGAERGTDYALEVVYNIIDSRYRAGKPMIVTTNLTLSEMQSEQHMKLKRIYDRIFEVCYPVHFTGVSLRMKAAADRYDEMKKMLEE